MDTAIFISIVVWLAVISWFDLRRSEIPHSAWVIIPLVLAIVYQSVLGKWPLVLFTLLITIVSERQLLARFPRFTAYARVKVWLPILLASLLWSAQSFPVATLSIFAFWVAWELGWWGGADATTATCLFLVFPTSSLLLSFILIHAITVICLATYSLLKEKRLRLHQIPGLPLLLLSTLLINAFSL
jgi:Flp pilus assembly protein protease CpaA